MIDTTPITLSGDKIPAIIWEDDAVAILSKPAGVVVNMAESVKEPTIQDWAIAHWGGTPSWAESQRDPIFAERSGMVHRLDKDTSGVLVWAKTSEAMHELMKQFQERDVHKTYLALVHGLLPEKRGIVRAAIDRNPQNRTKFTVTSDGRESETIFTVQKEFPPISPAELKAWCLKRDIPIDPFVNSARTLYEAGFSLVELQPRTGRTHQIRVHMDYLHHPLVGDTRYAGRKRSRLDVLWCPRQWLHAWKISFAHPLTNEELSFEAPVPTDLQNSLQLFS